MVFGESCLDRHESSLTYPDIKYGCLKSICEEALLKKAHQLSKVDYLSIVRLTKHVSHDTRPFDSWISNYKSNNEIVAFDDLYFSPIDFSSSASFIVRLLRKKLPGIFHYSNERDYNYFEFASLFNEFLTSQAFPPLRLVRSNSIEKGVKLLYKGKTTKLNLLRTCQLLDIQPLSLSYVFNYLLPYFTQDSYSD